MRQQREEYKLMRLREEGFWRDRPTWYGGLRGAGRPMVGGMDDGTGKLGPSDPPNGYIAYQPRLPAALLREALMVPFTAAGGKLGEEKGGIPVHHLVLMHAQLRQFRNALFVARALNRALILPYTLCSCEMGFFPYHLQPNCRAHDHPTM